MKCPKCGYLGFETSERCRNCGYDFSLAIDVAAPPELPLRTIDAAGAPLADFDLTRRDSRELGADLDLDRVIGADSEEDVDSDGAGGGTIRETGTRTAASPKRAAAARAQNRSIGAGSDASGFGQASTRTPSRLPTSQVRDASATPDPSRPADLPLFSTSDDDAPLITAPRPARPPLSVRRTTPEIPRVRARTVTPRPDEGELVFPSEKDLGQQGEPLSARTARITPPTPVISTQLIPASAIRRIAATLIDLAILASIDAAVIYLTLALTGLGLDTIGTLPIVPLVTFLVGLNAAYLVAFVAAGGQTIGKMVTNIRVVRSDSARVNIGGALLRALGCGLSLLTMGLGYLPAFVTAEHRALQDRIAGTRVVSAR